MKSLRALNSGRPSELIKTPTVLKILEEIVIHNYVTKTYLIRKLNSRHDIITKYLIDLEKSNIIKRIDSVNISLYTLNLENREANLIREFISKWMNQQT